MSHSITQDCYTDFVLCSALYNFSQVCEYFFNIIVAMFLMWIKCLELKKVNLSKAILSI